MNATSKEQRLRAANLRMMLGITLVLTSLLGAFCFLMGVKAKHVKAEKADGVVGEGAWRVSKVRLIRDGCGSRLLRHQKAQSPTCPRWLLLADLETLYVHQTEY